MAATFSVKNFEKFQHYKDRSPPWIRLYNSLLDDYDFGLLPDASKAHLLAIWLLASRYDNKIPYDTEWVSKRINATDPVDLVALEKAGFLIPDQPCSDMLADRKQLAVPEKSRAETEERREETATQSARGAEKFERLEAELREAAGLVDEPSSSLFDLSPMIALIDAGYDLSKDILPKLREAKARNKRGSSWRYYVAGITEAKVANGAIPAKPAAVVVTPMVRITTDDPRWPACDARWREERGKPMPHIAGEGGSGWSIPADWLESRRTA